MKIAQGAEALLFRQQQSVIKERVTKGYRHPLIDSSLRKSRTRREAKVIAKLNEIGFPVPKLNSVCDKSMKIDMEFIEGKKVRDVLEKDYERLAVEIGKKVAVLHSNDIIHGDLTTSNMLLADEIKFIDFGLSFFSTKEEDKAVDLHLLKRALESKHHTIFEHCFDIMLRSYADNYAGASLVLSRLEKVENRGRNKSKSH